MMARSKSRKGSRKCPAQELIIHGPQTTYFAESMGGGLIKEYAEIEVGTGKLWRYSCAYINPMIFSGDNGRVLGYDNAHGRPHRHFMGKITPEPNLPWDQIAAKFEREWRVIMKLFMEGRI